MDERDDLSQDDNPYRQFLNPTELPGEVPSDFPESSGPGPFRTIWSSPRETIRRIVATDPELHVTLLICLAGIGESLDRASKNYAGDKIPFEIILAFACILGPLGGLFGVWIYSHLIRISGKWIGGLGDYEEIKAAIAWASVPNVAGLVLWIPLLLISGNESFTEDANNLVANTYLAIAVLLLAIVQLILGIWSLVLLCNTIAEVQDYESAWRGLGNLFLAGAVIVIPLVIVALGLFLLFSI
jgi:hypothetical protein